jgi:hypothetical protein
MANLADLVDNALAAIRSARRWVAFWGPVTSAPALVGPFVALASVLMLAVVTGLAIGSLATLIIALVVLYILLTEVFGVSIDLVPA